MSLALDDVFHPRSLAVVGASNNAQSMGYNYTRLAQLYDFPGPIYPVNPNLEQILGLKCYPKITDIPGPVDYVISCVPSQASLELLDGCIAKGVKAIHFFTARMAETGRAEGAQMERALGEKARRAGIRIIGPNCMGIYHPKAGLSFKFNFPKEPGHVAFFSQSGTVAVDLVYPGALRGLRYGKVVSYGNALDLNEADFLDYLADDPETHVIGAYIEGVKDGRNFFQGLRKACQKKPVVLLKGGRTTAGTRAVASHTASMAGAQQVWEALCWQVGAVSVVNMTEMVDLLLAFQMLPPTTGLRLAVGGGGGGKSVQGADECEEVGFQLPSLPQKIREELRETSPGIWDWVSNPVDVSILGGGNITLDKLLMMMARSLEYDLILANLGEDFPLDRPEAVPGVQRNIDAFLQVGRDGGKPMTVVVGSPEAPEDWRRQVLLEARQRFAAAGIPTYPTIRQAAVALRRLVGYYRRREELRDSL